MVKSILRIFSPVSHKKSPGSRVATGGFVPFRYLGLLLYQG